MKTAASCLVTQPTLRVESLLSDEQPARGGPQAQSKLKAGIERWCRMARRQKGGPAGPPAPDVPQVSGAKRADGPPGDGAPP